MVQSGEVDPEIPAKKYFVISAPFGVQLRVLTPKEVMGNGVTIILSDETPRGKVTEVRLDDAARRELITALQAWDG